MTDTLSRVGSLPLEDEPAFHATLDQADALCQQLRHHVGHENDFVHPALEAAQPGSAERIRHEHVEHLDAIASLEDAVLVLRRAAPAQRPVLAQRLYRQLALFVADNLQHMNVEETAHNAVLWARYSDAELQALDGRIIASLTPPEMAHSLHWLARALAPHELAGLLAAVRPGMPPEAFAGVLDLVRQALANDDAAYQRALRGLAQAEPA